MKRTLEKEIMDDKEQVTAYARADFSTTNNLFIAKVSRYNRKNILDLGCGPADIPIILAGNNPNIRITAVDASSEMLDYARKQIKSRKLDKNITLVKGKIPGLAKSLNNRRYDFIISKDLLHHLPQPAPFWEEIKKLSNKGTAVMVMDLIRPDNKEQARKMVESGAKNEAKILKTDFYNSLLAAFTIKEIKQQLKTAKLNLKVENIGSRHFLVKGKM
ncbi:MAG: class I SAM-dependent methyltransferase [Patescibacteria group bacterium]|jgi:2-polyprenyl-3-methyl-5-hydroxy-6-metoxy-1,4-benzoquinol methylase